MRRSSSQMLASTALVLGGLASCASPARNVWNLEQLHDGETRHRYVAALESDTGYFIRHEVLGLFEGAGADFAAEKSADPIEDPSGECLYNLVQLQERARSRSEPDPRHVEWFARVAVEDPSRLSRERAVLALAEYGQRFAIGLPSRLGTDQKPAGPEQLAPVLEELVRAVRKLAEKRENAAEDVTKSCAAVRALDLDLAAGRRALRASTELLRLAATGDVASKDLDELVRHLESLCVRRALAAALEDSDDLVCAAAVRGVARTGGGRALDVVLFERLRPGTQPRTLRALLEVIAEVGLPQRAEGATAPARSTESWLAAIQEVAVEHPDGELRVRAMRTLQAVAAPEVRSLREEDWHAWWIARKSAAAPAPSAASAGGTAPSSGSSVPPP